MKVKKQYTFLNKMAKGNGIVLWGSTSLEKQPINELLQNFDVSKNIYNRSVSGLTLAAAEDCLEQCVYELKPSKVIINLGEEDLKDSDDVARLVEQYRWILYKIHVALPKCQLIVTTVQSKSESCDCFNEELKKLAEEFGCTFYQIPAVPDGEEYGAVFLSAVKLSLYDSKLGYSGIATRAVFDLMMQ